MIHDGAIEVTCDGCDASAMYPMPYVHRGKSGYYDDDEDKIEKWLVGQEWVVRGGRHFCCRRCAK